MKDLTQGSILKNLLIFSWPIVLGDLMHSLYSAIDAFWVGRLIGPEALAAVSASMPVLFMLVSLLIGLAVSTSILAGQAFGAKDTALLSKILVNSFMAIIALTVLFTAAGIALSLPILRLLSTPEEIIHDAQLFLNIIFGGMIFMFVQNWFSGILRGAGDSKTPLIILAFYVALNIILAPALITGWGPFPKLGIAGSALATVISGAVTSAAALVYLARKNPLFNILKWEYRFDPAIVKRILVIGIPVSLQMIIVSLSGLLIISLVNGFGFTTVAAYGIGLRIDQFSFIPAMSLGGSAAAAFAAQALGAGRQEKIPEIVKWVSVLTLSFALFFFVIVNIFPAQITSIFTTDAGVIEKTVPYFRYVTFTYFAFALMFTFQGVIRGSGDTLPSMFFAFITLIIFRAGLGWALSSKTGMNETGIWLAMAVSAYVGMTLNWLYYKSGRWKRFKKPKTEPPPLPGMG
ncbi:MAG TPA: MATE family efflux transporter [bacterium]|nr:MATE family efflux transporter [bacterium]